MKEQTKLKLIFKNTMMLYVRMLLMMGVMLYTSRVVLDVLGVEDYGLYSVVGGVVAMFTIISGSLTAAISRFITFELGSGNQERLNRIFATSIVIQLAISAVIIVLSETIGMWVITNKMVIPEGRVEAAQWVMHFSLITLVVNLISIPYNAAIIAHERMIAFAYISIIDVIGKLIIVYLVVVSPVDKLISYAIAMCANAVLVRFIYSYYCRKNFVECRNISFAFDRTLFKDMLSFAGWNYIGSASGVLRTQGCSLLLNVFFGTVVNASQGIANQVTSAVNQFSANFMTALNPQITKSYAAGDKEYMMTLIHQGSRLSFFMLLLLSLPVILQTEYVLTLWLNEVPIHTIAFVKLSLIFGLVEVISTPLITAMLATGCIRNYQLVVGGIQIMNLPVSYIILRMGGIPEVVMIVAILLSACCLITRLFFLKGLIGLNPGEFAKKVIFNILAVSLSSVIIPLIALNFLDITFLSFVLIGILTLISVLVSVYCVGCNRDERIFLRRKLMSFFNHKLNIR